MSALEQSALFPEWSELHAGIPVRQGDVVGAIGTEPEPWRRLLVVLTADCDLARSKHGGALSCVPILRCDEYLLAFRYEKLRTSLSDRLVELLLKTHLDSDPAGTAPTISTGRMQEWVIEADPLNITSTLQLSGQSADRFQAIAGCVKSLAGAHPSSVQAAANQLAEAKMLLGDAKDHGRAEASVGAAFADALKNLPGDALFINEVSPQHIDGYVIYLRRIVELNESALVLSQSRIPHDASHLRISRLRSPYVYALSQQFGGVYSAIGLPTEYESARDLTLDRIRNLEAVS